MQISNISLTYPNFKWDGLRYTGWHIHPYNLGLLSAVIGDKYSMSIIDSDSEDLTREDFSRRLKDNKPDILGISLIANEYANSGLIAAEIAKETDPNIKTIVGGVSATSNPLFFIKNPNVDYVVMGEGEYVFRDLCNFLNQEGDLPKKGIMYKENEKIVDNGKADLIEDLNKLPLPSYHLVDFKKYTNKTQRESVDRPRAMPYARIRTSRGCPFNCCFCEVGSISGKKPRLRSLESVAKELEWLIGNYSIKGLMFDDDNLVVDKKRSKDLFKMMIDRNYGLKWSAPGMAVYLLDEEMISLMKESGSTFLNIAIESGNQRVLSNIIHKPLDLKKSKKTIKKIKEYGIDLAANFVIGFPGETFDEVRETIKFAEDIDVDYVKIYIATPFPHTELYKIAKDGGYLREGFDNNKHLWTEGWITSDKFRYQDLKILRAYEWDRINFSNPEKRKKIAKMMDVTEGRLDEIRKETLKIVNP